ncbi:hypothetical protein PSTG_13120 [Puccinia striiformis f. sp. tritici PST-78]|uniref:Uncharacterized protein n=1 Tax=Puccinia striiformis f. sp. tritici PST-78 TaxID=1165861 RepID=A0A0L0V2H8_9BASI|nr:hypothetical protein PSTG_13120 [Puccinia striiformis f. sp. tritici PST-78]
MLHYNITAVGICRWEIDKEESDRRSFRLSSGDLIGLKVGLGIENISTRGREAFAGLYGGTLEICGPLGTHLSTPRRSGPVLGASRWVKRANFLESRGRIRPKSAWGWATRSISCLLGPNLSTYYKSPQAELLERRCSLKGKQH